MTQRTPSGAAMTTVASILFLSLSIIVAACAPVATERVVDQSTPMPDTGGAERTDDDGVEQSEESSENATPEDQEVLLPTPTPQSTPLPTVIVEDAAGSETSLSQQSDIVAFEVGNELTIAALTDREIEPSDIVIERQLADGANYSQYVASYLSEDNKIFGLLTVPHGDMPEKGHPAIVFIHGFIPPEVYRTTERYEAYVDALARNGFVVFKIDLRGFGDSEGEASGAYFSPDYTVDAISALKSLQGLDYVDPQRIGMWGHSMAGNVLLRAMLVEPDVQAGVIWAGAVYSYEDMARYAIDDPSFRREERPDIIRRGTVLRDVYGPPNLESTYWQAVALTDNIALLEAPLQIHHALDDGVVNPGYSQDLAAVLQEAGKVYELHLHEGGGHNITSPYFSEAMQRTIEFFRTYL